MATAKTALADVFTQKVLEKREHLDFRRVGVFTAFGFFYLGLFQYKLYVTLFSKWFSGTARFANQPLAAKLKDTRANSTFSSRLHLTTLCTSNGFSQFITSSSSPSLTKTITSSTHREPSRQFRARQVLEELSRRLDGILENLDYWRCLCYGAVPVVDAVPANHAISFVYVIVLSFMRGANDQEPAEKTQALPVEAMTMSTETLLRGLDPSFLPCHSPCTLYAGGRERRDLWIQRVLVVRLM